MAWVEQYIGRPWVRHEYDCWAFFREVQREQFGVAVPEIPIDATDLMAVAKTLRDHGERSQWRAVAEPADGDAVLMSKGRYPTHIGVWVGKRVLHCLQGAGVVYSGQQALDVAGWTRRDFYRYVGSP